MLGERQAVEPPRFGVEPGEARLAGDREGQRVAVSIRCGGREAVHDADGAGFRRRAGDLRCGRVRCGAHHHEQAECDRQVRVSHDSPCVHESLSRRAAVERADRDMQNVSRSRREA